MNEKELEGSMGEQERQRSETRENLITKTAHWAMEIVSQYVKEGDTVIDATMGNGHDTLALAKLVGSEGRVLAFDIQPQALEYTAALLREEGIAGRMQVGEAGGEVCKPCDPCSACVSLILDSNANLRRYTEEELRLRRKDGEERRPEISAVLFNLGYLPGGDKSVTTTKEETLLAVSEALAVVKRGGLVAAVLYGGHPQGAEEKEALLEWAKELPAREYHAAYISMWNQKKNPPEILLITKK